MRRCLGCFEQINDGMSACPYCGFSERMSPPNAQFITPGCLLSNRYSIGRVISTDSESINYIAWDSTSNLKVLIREFYPSDYVIRESGSFNVRPISSDAAIAFNNGFSRFVEKAKQLYASGGNEKLFDCISDNGTAYMILECKINFRSQNVHATSPNYGTTNRTASSPATPVIVSSNPQSVNSKQKYQHIPLNTASNYIKQEPAKKAQAPSSNASSKKASNPISGITVVTSKKKQNRAYNFMRKISLIPLWVKVTVPSAIVVTVVLIILFSKGIIKFKPKTTVESSVYATTVSTTVTATTTGITKETTETDPIVLVINGPSMSFKGHSYALFSNADTWETAKAHCESLGGHLAVITSKEENDAIWAFAQKNKCKSVFFGLSNTGNNEWKWVNGEQLRFTKWNENKPSVMEEEKYGEFSFYVEGGVWNNSRFESHFNDSAINYICEWESDVSGAAKRKVTYEEALLSFRYYMAKLISKSKLKKNIDSSWGFNKIADNNCIFHYLVNKKKCVVFYMDLNSGHTTSITYTDSSLRNATNIGAYDFNAWEYLDDKTKITNEVSTIELQDYLGKNIRIAATALGGLGNIKQSKVSYFENKYLRLSTGNTNGSLDIATIALSGSSKSYSIYSVEPGMSLKDAITRLMISGSVKLYSKNANTIIALMEDGNAIQITLSKKQLVSSIKIWREIT